MRVIIEHDPASAKGFIRSAASRYVRARQILSDLDEYDLPEGFERVLGLGGNEDDAEITRELVGRGRLDLDVEIAPNTVDGHALIVEGVDMFFPAIDKEHIVAGLGHVSASKTADGAGTDNGEFHW